tara:strand:- start:456 stop:734 length:279 start_codon:yes stop_codon:yes gene_type:complete
MAKIKRKIKRNNEKKKQKSIQEHMMWFDKMPDHCVACFKPYIKNNKEMAQKWTVVVRKKEDKVNLYCDSCWNDANNMIQEIKEDLNEHKKSN